MRKACRPRGEVLSGKVDPQADRRSGRLLARRFHARHAAMLVHSFSESAVGFDDFQAFAAALGTVGLSGQVVGVPGHSNPTLSLGWVQDKKPYA